MTMWNDSMLAKERTRLAEELQFIEYILVRAIEFEQHYGRHPSAADLQQELHRIAAKEDS